MKIKRMKSATEKTQIIEEVLSDLPEWFGLPESTKEYIKDGSALPLWAAYVDNEVVGFVTLTNSSEDCGDVHCMGGRKFTTVKELGIYSYRPWRMKIVNTIPIYK